MRRFIIDSDTATDDAVGLVMALRCPEIKLEAITVSAGNVSLEQAIQNALFTVSFCESDTPVFAGASAPLAREREGAENVHGPDGMGGIGLDLAGRVPAAGFGPDKIVEIVQRLPGEVTLVIFGPLTNLALALQKAPQIADDLDRVVVLGGAGFGPGNVTPLAEFNFWVDPEAASAVIGAGVQLELVGWDLVQEAATLTVAEMDEIRQLGRYGDFCVSIQKAVIEFCAAQGIDGCEWPDPIALAIAIDASIATKCVPAHAVIDTSGGEARGAAIFDTEDQPDRPIIQVVTEASRGRFVDLLHSTLG